MKRRLPSLLLLTLLGIPAPGQELDRRPIQSKELSPGFPKTVATALSLDQKDSQFVADTLNEILRGATIKRVWQLVKYQDLTAAAKIIRPFCGCTDEQFDDWVNDRALPSVDRKMQEAKVPPKLLAKYTSEFKAAQLAGARIAPAQAQIDYLTSVLTLRLMKIFNNSLRNQYEYKFDLAGGRFVEKERSEPGSSLETQVKAQVAIYLEEHEKEIIAGLKAIAEEETAKLKASTPSPRKRAAPRKPKAKPAASAKGKIV